ncbi:hypothetical protein [Sporosarcina luteola]|uniref:hypothetical protein n=1 Tax=Sporosarcina luteola TaxID=582850 RepID=UPI00203F1CEF|nr:hypothetical protein [Sporosarcina luteola]MCM3711113.1 hypothetical protein [Sporosarcina luteola]
MKRLIIIVALLVVVLSACATNDANSNTISAVELTERENAILSTTSDYSFVFDFNVESEYEEVTVWIEKYELGKLVNDRMSSITSQVEEKGSIIFTSSKAVGSPKQSTFNIGISSNSSIGSSTRTNTDDLDAMSSVWGNIQGESNSVEGVLVLASICYSSDGHMSSLNPGFYKNVDDHMNKLEEYEVVYLLKAEFNK